KERVARILPRATPQPNQKRGRHLVMPAPPTQEDAGKEPAIGCSSKDRACSEGARISQDSKAAQRLSCPFSRHVSKAIGANRCSSTHALFERAGGHWETKVVANVLNSISTGGIQIPVRAFCLDNERSGFGAHYLAVSLRVSSVNEQLDIPDHVQVPRRNINELHSALLPTGLHHAQGQPWPDDEVLNVASVDSRRHFQETCLPGLPFPAMGGIGVNAKAF